MVKPNHEDKEFLASIEGFIVIALIVICIWGSTYYFMPKIFPPDQFSAAPAGTAGDMFGGITALFSGLAFAGLVTTLFMQRRELELQRKELSQTREVFQMQQFESTFFGLINLLSQHVQSIESGPEGNVQKGRDALVSFALSLPSPHQYIEGDRPWDPPTCEENSKPIREIVSEYEDTYRQSLEKDLGPYFRLIYNVLRHIEHTEFSKDENENIETKFKYSKILRAHLNSSEVKLLMFNCASVHGKSLKSWVEKHSMLKHITRKDYQDYIGIVGLYDENAFQYDKRGKSK